MTQYRLMQLPGTVLTSDSPLLRAADIERVAELGTLIEEVAREREELPKAREAARAEGFEAGRAEGEAAGREAVMEAGSKELAAALTALGVQRADTRDEATALALAIVRRVLPQVAGDAMLARLIETAAAELQDEQPHAVRVRPEEAAGLEEALGSTGLSVEADDALEAGQAVLVTRGGTAEAGLEARLGVLTEALRG